MVLIKPFFNGVFHFKLANLAWFLFLISLIQTQRQSLFPQLPISLRRPCSRSKLPFSPASRARVRVVRLHGLRSLRYNGYYEYQIERRRDFSTYSDPLAKFNDLMQIDSIERDSFVDFLPWRNRKRRWNVIANSASGISINIRRLSVTLTIFRRVVNDRRTFNGKKSKTYLLPQE